MYILNFSYFSLVPLFFVGILFLLLNKKKNQEKQSQARQKKDDLWHIVKQYLKATNKRGYTIQDLTLYPRPETKKLNSYLFAAECKMLKDKANADEVKYEKPIRQEQYPIEAYFLDIENETRRDEPSIEVNKKINDRNRKRFVVCYRLKLEIQNVISNWECIELELFQRYDEHNNLKYEVSFNKKLDYEKEIFWIYPMQMEYLEKLKHQEIEEENRKNKKLAKNKKGYFSNFFHKWTKK